MSTAVRKAVKVATTLAAAYVAGSGSMVLAPAGGNLIGAGSTFLVIGPNGNTSAFSCSGVSGDTLTGVSLVDGVDEYFPAGSVVELAATTAAGGGGGSGTVTSVSVVTANGYSGSVANPTTTPAITISGPAASGGGLVPTATKTADYTAAVGDFVPVDTSLGNVTITLPTTPASGSMVSVKYLSGGGNLVLGVGGSDTFYPAASPAHFANEGWTFLYHAASARWYTVGDDLPMIGLDGRYLTNSIAASRLPTTGLTITQHAGAIIVPSGTSGTITMDLSLGDWQAPAALTGTATFALTNPTVGQQFTVIVIGGGNALTWFTGILWPGGTTPTLTATAGKRDIFTFKCLSAGVYAGFIVGQNL